MKVKYQSSNTELDYFVKDMVGVTVSTYDGDKLQAQIHFSVPNTEAGTRKADAMLDRISRALMGWDLELS